VRLMPEHIWRPILTSGTPAQIQGATPDVNMITSGAWRFREYLGSATYVDLVANKPGRTVTTSWPGDVHGVPITSPKGFFRYYPKYIDVHGDDYKARISPTYPAHTVDVHLTATDENLLRETFNFTGLTPLLPNPTGQHIMYRSCEWTILEYVDQTPPPGLSFCDRILIAGVTPVEPAIWMHVKAFDQPENTLVLGQIIEADKRVYVDDGLLPGVWPVHEYEKPGVPIVETFTVNLHTGYHLVVVQKVITTEWMLQQDNTVVPFPWKTTIFVTWPLWITIPEDIAGSTYLNSHLSAPDFKVDLTDILAAAIGFGSYPGHPAWDENADLTHDYKIDLTDYLAIAIKFGWTG